MQETTNTEPTKDRIVITKAELNWVALALSKDHHRKILTQAKLIRRKGVSYLFATDAARLHAIRIEDGADVEVTLDVKRILFELNYVGRSAFAVSLTFRGTSWCTADILDEKMEVIETIARDVLFREAGTYPNVERVVPSFSDVNLVDPTPSASFNFTYLTDAAKMSASRSNRVALFGKGDMRPYVVAPTLQDPWDSAWFAVIMPMYSDAPEKKDKK